MPYKDKEKQKEYMRKWIAKRKQEYFQDKVCVKCGADEKLELDHIDYKEKEYHAIWSWSEKRRLRELEKCQVLCESCHKIKTKEDYLKRNPIEHGTHNSYSRRSINCRCDKCTEAHKLYRREQIARKLAGTTTTASCDWL